MQTAHRTLGGKFCFLLFPGALLPPFSPSFPKPLLVLVEISYLWYSFLEEDHTKKEAEVSWWGKFSCQPSLAGRQETWTPDNRAGNSLSLRRTSQVFPGMLCEICFSWISALCLWDAKDREWSPVYKNGIHTISLLVPRTLLGLSNTHPVGVGHTRKLQETLLCLSGIGWEETLGHPRWKEMCRSGCSFPPRESKPGWSRYLNALLSSTGAKPM